MQALAVCLSIYVLHLGWVRFRFAHLGRKDAAFPWRRHVRLGAAVLATWALAFALGLGAVWWAWRSVFVTGRHVQVALAMLPLIAFGLGSGMVMDRVKARRTLLPLAHGLGNAVLVLLALLQLYTGGIVLWNMAFG
ncbi:MAG: DUF4079 domain-containing protein [Proteobacteria bacterium]|nr:DUF4079 domain-containing protein [Pseudomonadota bacterium]MBU1596302.1 DUF4079 domain-containing protein [Pseudomonadota bacterium]